VPRRRAWRGRFNRPTQRLQSFNDDVSTILVNRHHGEVLLPCGISSDRCPLNCLKHPRIDICLPDLILNRVGRPHHKTNPPAGHVGLRQTVKLNRHIQSARDLQHTGCTPQAISVVWHVTTKCHTGGKPPIPQKIQCR